MNKKTIAVDELKQTSTVFSEALIVASKLSTDSLFKALKGLEYKAFGFGGILLFSGSGADTWEASLRNDATWYEPTLACKGGHREAIELLYAWCVHKKYLPVELEPTCHHPRLPLVNYTGDEIGTYCPHCRTID